MISSDVSYTIGLGARALYAIVEAIIKRIACLQPSVGLSTHGDATRLFATVHPLNVQLACSLTRRSSLQDGWTDSRQNETDGAELRRGDV